VGGFFFFFPLSLSLVSVFLCHSWLWLGIAFITGAGEDES
jgi:hypothetical protein